MVLTWLYWAGIFDVIKKLSVTDQMESKPPPSWAASLLWIKKGRQWLATCITLATRY